MENLTTQPRSRRRASSREPAWVRLSDEELLDLRLCDLGVRIEGTALESRVEELYAELAGAGLSFRPRCWLSSEWFAPDDIPGIAMPFYLTHPRLMRLEDRQMFEIEGGTKKWCMQLLRHEAGHAYETAYRLSRRKNWREQFGSASQPYPEYYRPQPFSRDYVLHLDWWYAQSHPCEDFAETFAVWLRPGSNWRKRYHHWPAVKKLEYVDRLMEEIGGKTPPKRSKARVEPIDRLTTTLREHYREKQERYGSDYPDFYDAHLRRLFVGSTKNPRGRPAASFLRRLAPELRKRIARWTGEYAYTINMVLKDMIARSRELDLRVSGQEDNLKLEAAIFLTMQTMNYLHSKDHRVTM